MNINTDLATTTTDNKSLMTSTPNIVSFDYERHIATLSPSEREKCMEVAKTLDVHNNGSIQQYGSDISSIIAQNGNVLLNSVKSSNNIEIVKYINDLVAELDGFDNDILEYTGNSKNILKKFIYSLPGMKKIKKSLTAVMTQYATVSENVDKISQKISAAKMIALRDNNTIQQIFENNQEYIKEIRKYIIAAKLKDSDISKEIERMNSEGCDPIELQQVTNYLNRLKKRIADMQTTEYVFYQNLFQLAALQENNNAIAEKSDNITTHVIPLWKNQLPMAIILKNQEANIKANNMITETTNKMLIKTAKDLRINSINVAKASEESVININTLHTTTQELINTIKTVKEIHDNANKERKTLEDTLCNLSKSIEDATIGYERQLENKVS